VLRPQPFSRFLSSSTTKLSTSKAVTDKPVSLRHQQRLVSIGAGIGEIITDTDTGSIGRYPIPVSVSA